MSDTPGRQTLQSIGLISLCLLIYLTLALLRLDRMPDPDADEAWFANPALNLLHQGNFGSSTLAGLLGFDHVTLWVPPLQSLVLVIPIKLFGLHLWSIRLMSVLWGLLILLALYRTGLVLGVGQRAAILFLLFLGTDFSFLNLARFARDEALLGFLQSAMLFYLARASVSNRTAPLLVAGVLAGLSFLTHPLALFSVPVFLLFLPPKRPTPGEPIDWRDWTKKALVFGGAVCVTCLPFVFYVLHEGLHELWEQSVAYKAYAYQFSGVMGGPITHFGRLLVEWSSSRERLFFTLKIVILAWLAWPPKKMGKLCALCAIQFIVLAFFWPRINWYYWVPGFYVTLALCAAGGKVSKGTSPGCTTRWMGRPATLVLVGGLIALNLFAYSHMLRRLWSNDPERFYTQLHDLVASQPGGKHTILGDASLLFAFPDDDLRCYCVVRSTMDLRGISWQQALFEVSPDIVVLDPYLPSGEWYGFFVPPHGIREFLRRNGTLLGTIETNPKQWPVVVEVYKVDPRIFSRE